MFPLKTCIDVSVAPQTLAALQGTVKNRSDVETTATYINVGDITSTINPRSNRFNSHIRPSLPWNRRKVSDRTKAPCQ